MLSTQALKGERVTIYDRNGEGFAWGQLDSDGYVGWLPDAALGEARGSADHKVTAIRTFAFPGPSIKLPPLDTLPMGAMLDCSARGRRVRRDARRMVSAAPASRQHRRDEKDFVAVAERFVGTPYLWGGKSSLGIDCSGLVQVALNAAGIGCPRDSDMQQDGLGRTLDAPRIEKLQRGDLIFWKGHVAIVRDADDHLHANAHHMATAIENTASDAGSAAEQSHG